MTAVEQLSVLFPERCVLTIAHRQVVVSEMALRKIAHFAVHLAPALARFPDGASFDAMAVLMAAGEPVIRGLAHAVDESPEWVGGLVDADFERLARAVHDANREFFRTRARPPRFRRHGDDAEEQRQPAQWQAVLEALIARGHRDPGAYTLRQIEMYLASIARGELEQRKARLVDLRAAVGPDPAPMKDILDRLDHAIERLAQRDIGDSNG